MTPEPTLQADVVKQKESFCYKHEVSTFHLINSRTYRNLCRIVFIHEDPETFLLHKNIKGLSPECWDSLNHLLVVCVGHKKTKNGKEFPTDESWRHKSVELLPINPKRESS